MFLFTCTISQAQTNKQICLNREYNQLTYVYRQIWRHLAKYKVASLHAYSSDGETIV